MTGPASITGATRLAAVIGDPVRHSLSPALMNAAFAATALDWVYVALPVSAGQATSALEAMRTLGIGGLSVTMPHKHDVAAGVDRTSAAARALAAVNCVRRDGDQLVGENTDGDGFVRSLVGELGVSAGGLRCAVVGAGGAAKAVIRALGVAGADEVVVINRTHSSAEFAASLADGVGRVGTIGDLSNVDLIVNATSVGMGDGALPFDVGALSSDHIVADLIYHPLQTPLLVAAAAAGAQTMNGIGMLLHQAAIQFELWTGHTAPIEAMRDGLEAELARRFAA
jgi:shikimate dehydrogenase